MYIAVVGSSEPDPQNEKIAYELGKLIAKNGATLICGGLGGIMNAAAKGVNEAGGTSIGILPSDSRSNSSEYLTFALSTGLGEARNTVIAKSADVMIAIGGEFGTLSEISFALKAMKPVIGINTWHLSKNDKEAEAIARAKDAQDAIDLAIEATTE
ncbi:MAG: TIGR00725 family protein [Actinobacteria bacterium]|nr:MAG: TIGR00725 family protein [Actinomycetota bacterium]